MPPMKYALVSLALSLAACGQTATTPNNSYGPNPELPAPSSSPIPTVNTARAVGWPANGAPQAPPGFAVNRYAQGLRHPRGLYTMPNGDVLVAESSTQPDTGGGIGDWIKNSIQRGAGALAGSANRITLLRDADHDGIVDSRSVFAERLNQPFGMALIGDYFYVANTDSVLRFRYRQGATRVDGPGEVILRLPYHGGDNGHWTRTLAASPDGSKLFVSVGSSSNIADYGMEVERGRAAIWVMNPDGGDAHVYASGLRNPAGLDFDPHTGALWTSVNERDVLGDNLPPDYLTHVQEGGFYGWPYSYWGRHVDARVRPQNPALVATAITPDFALGAHTASLGLHFYRGTALPEHYRTGAFVGQHGSWNRSQLVGYKVVFVPFENGRPSGAIEDFLTGFLNARNEAQGRPVGVGEDATGALLVADDVGNIIWRVAPAAP
jgi:glucose/arabinose dehydrogenase